MFIHDLESIIRDRIAAKSSDSYVSSLVSSGVDRILKKIGEEAGEVIIAAKKSQTRPLSNLPAADFRPKFGLRSCQL